MPDTASNEQQLASLFHRAFAEQADALVVVDLADDLVDSRVIYANAAFARIVAKPRDTLSGARYGAFCRPEGELRQTGAGSLEGEVAIATRETGFACRVRAAPVGDTEGVPRFLAIAHDVPACGPRTALAPDGDTVNRLLDGVAAGLVVHRLYQPLYANPTAARLLGCESVEELLAQPTLLRFLPLDHWEAGLDRSTRVLEGAAGDPPAISRTLTATGAPIWLEIGTSRVDWQGEPAIVATFVDASDHVRARKSEELLREAVDNLSDSFILYDPDDRVVLTNQRFHEIFPFLPPQDEITGVPMVELVRGSVEAGAVTDPTLRADNKEEWITAFVADRRHHPMSITEDAWPNGRWDLVKEQRLESGGFVSVRTDITHRKRNEFALKDQEVRLAHELAERSKHLEAVLANIGQGVIVLNPDLRVVLTNPGLHEIVGYPYELGRPGTHVEALIRDRLEHGLFLPGEGELGEDIEAIVQRRLEAYKTLTRESFEHPFPGGRLVAIERERLSDGSIICTFTDITEKTNTERELQQQREALYQREKLSALGMLLAGVSHELNNPLSIVLGQSSLMESMALDKTQRERAQRIRKAADRCAKIIKTFLALARDKPASRAPVKLGELVEQAVDLLGYQFRNAGIEVVHVQAASLPDVQGDADQLNQVVVNLLINAVQAMEGIETARRLTVETRYLSANHEVELTVSDTGPGVPEEVRRRIFDPFYTTKPTGVGTGVGLSLCHGLVTAHGGRIWVDETPGGGARFQVRLPCAPRDAASPTAAPAAAPTAGKGRVLVVDDEPEIREILSDFLEPAGLTVDAVENGRVALSRLETSDYDAVVCDLRMPGMDGPTLFAEATRLSPALRERFVFATGDLLTESSSSFLAESGRPYLEKPFQPEQVRRIVAQVVAQAGAGGGTPK